MIKQIFLMIWNRKRQNALMMVGVFISFFSLFLVFTTMIYMLSNYLKPLGFEYEDVWYMNPGWGLEEKDEVLETLRQVEYALDTYPEIESYSFSNTFLFVPAATNTRTYLNDGKEVYINQGTVGDEFDDVLNIQILAGRWFDERDNASARPPVVINEQVRDEFFPGKNPVGEIMVNKDGKEFTVIGLIGEFRSTGDFTGSKQMMFHRGMTSMSSDWLDQMDGMFSRILFRVKPGSTRELEQRIQAHVNDIAKNWKVKMGRLDEARESANNQTMVLPIIMAIICGFLIINVALGLFGVIWYNTKRRTSEIGLRRALGSTIAYVRRQITGEAMVLATFGMIIGLFFALQFPLLGVMGFISSQIYLAAALLSVVIIYGITFLCALYPSNQASRIEPAIALHSE